ncbi:E3 ubiquitin/ISG15 ligase TRIM25-like [Cololabis saira]|uniref:E3 ubiquitin/ISG15 ligase TRIM25-like n=1 Tax=Cololabis saira TaxID=129043 RepID=UPI002AD580DA|nr:E3 ubiquitin/ISG15 ligase TRIM25-like [Cololabis saira]
MAQKGDQLDQESFSCSICLEVLKDPVTIPCGHSYCMNCIKTHWDEGEKKLPSCPQCRETFIPRPALVKNTMFAALVEQLKKTGLQAAPADHCYAGPEDVACDVCSGRKLKAVKSCLVCLASYCQKHLQPHRDSSTFKHHQLVDPSKNLQDNICPRHGDLRKMFCRTDQKCICYLCSVEEHKGHDTVSAAAERAERQREVVVRRQQIQQEIQDREKDVKLLQQEVEAINQSADGTVEDSEEMFTELISLLQKRSSEVKQQVRSQQEIEVRRVRELEEKLQQEIRDLKRRDAEMKQLSDTEDHNQFLHSWPSLPPLSESTHSSSISIRPLTHSSSISNRPLTHSSSISNRPLTHSSSISNRPLTHSSSISNRPLTHSSSISNPPASDVTAAVSEVRGRLQDILRDTWKNVSLAVTEVDVLLSETESRAGFLKYSCEITLDPNTVHTWLLLSEENRKVTFLDQRQSYSDHPDRFKYPQVLSRESLTGRHYWEVETADGVSVAVSYKNISRSGNESLFGYNDKSWSLYCSSDSYMFRYNNIQTSISGPWSSRIGVYLDHRAGVLSFYSVSGTMTLLHRVQTSFTEPLRAGVRIYLNPGRSAEFCKLK